MLHFTKTLLISALAVSLAACSNSSPEAQNSPNVSADSPSVSSASSSSPQEVGAANKAVNPNTGGKRFAQELKLLQTLKSGKAGETIKIPVSVTNTSNFAWDSGSANPVNFSYNWYDSQGNRVVWDAERTPLPKALAPQGSIKLNPVIKFPERPGNYTLALTMVQEGVTWFNDAGAQSPKIPVTVTSK